MTGVMCNIMAVGSKPFVSLPAAISIYRTFPPGGSVTLTWNGSGGSLVWNGDAPGSHQWIQPPVGMNGYEARLTQNSGTALSGSLRGAWLLAENPLSWTLTASPSQNLAAGCTLEIRDDTTLAVVASCPVNFAFDAR